MRYGHVKLSRKLFDGGDKLWEEKREFSRFEAWLDLIQRTAFRPTTYSTRRHGTDQLDRGEFVASVRFLAKRWGWSKSAAQRFLEALEKAGHLVGQRKGQHGAIYRLAKYEAYQGNASVDGTETGTPSGTPVGHSRDTRGTKKKQLSNKAVKQETPSLAADAASGDGARPTTWLTPVSAVWESRMGAGTFPWPIAGRALKPLSEHHEGGEIAAHLGEYLDATRPEFVNLHKFSQTFAKWKPESPIDPATGWFTAKAQAWYDGLPKA